MRIFPLAASSVAMWISLASCSSAGTSSAGSSSASSTGAGGGGDAFTAIVDKFCNEVAGPFCEADWTCCMRAGYHFGNNLEDCKKQVVSSNFLLTFCASPSHAIDRADLEASLRARTTTFDQTQFDACL